MKALTTACCLAFVSLTLTGCIVARKATTVQRVTQYRAVVSENGTVVYPSTAALWTATNSTAINFTALAGTNATRWSLRGCLFGYARSFTIARDVPRDHFSGSDKALLDDASVTNVASIHANQVALGGNSQFSIGSASTSVSTNGLAEIRQIFIGLATNAVTLTGSLK